jgi:hypothetical protein
VSMPAEQPHQDRRGSAPGRRGRGSGQGRRTRGQGRSTHPRTIVKQTEVDPSGHLATSAPVERGAMVAEQVPAPLPATLWGLLAFVVSERARTARFILILAVTAMVLCGLVYVLAEGVHIMLVSSPSSVTVLGTILGILASARLLNAGRRAMSAILKWARERKKLQFNDLGLAVLHLAAA